MPFFLLIENAIIENLAVKVGNVADLRKRFLLLTKRFLLLQKRFQQSPERFLLPAKRFLLR